MKRPELLDIFIYFSIIVILAIIGFLCYTIPKTNLFSRNTSEPQITSKPTESIIIGVVKKITANSLTLDTGQNIILTGNTVVNNVTPDLPYLSAKGNGSITEKNVGITALSTGDKLGIESSQDNKGNITADTITINHEVYFLPGIITEISDNTIEVNNPPISTNAPADYKKGIKMLTYTIKLSSATEINETHTGMDKQVTNSIIALPNLKLDDNVFIYSLDNPDTTTTITAEIVNLQTLDTP